MYVSVQNIRCITCSLLIIFSLYIFTFYWIITSPIVSLSNEERGKDFEDNAWTLATARSDNQNVLVGSDTGDEENKSDIGDKLPVVGNKFEAIEAEIKDRIKRVSDLCQKYHLGRYKWSNGSNDLNEKEPPTPLYSYYFWNREKHLGWCPVYKAGSTSWLQNMMILAGFPEKELENPPKQLSFLARDVYGDKEPDPETLKQSLKLLVVRHPFERLISAYRDKLANATIGHEHGTLHFYRKYGEKIVKKFRKDKQISQIEPTWEEFVRYLLHTNLIHYADDHWLPAYFSCTPCLVDYDIIAKTETFTRDQEYIIYKAGLEGILKPRWNHENHFKIEDSSSDGTKIIGRKALVEKYFSQLTKSQIEGLYKKYWFDFELFGYDFKQYLKYGRDELDNNTLKVA